MSSPWRTLLPRSTVRVCNRPATLTLKVASLCAANDPITATVDSITWSATVATVTARAGRFPAGSRLEPAVACFEQLGAASVRAAVRARRGNDVSHFIRFLPPYNKAAVSVSYDF